MKDNNKKVLPLQIAMLPLIFLVTLLSFNLYANVFIYDADPLAGSSQFILIVSGAFAAMIGYRYNVSYKDVISSCLLYTSPSPRDQRGSRMPSSA